MTQLHELLAAEKTPTGAWNTLIEDTRRKFKNPDQFYNGYTKSLSMIEDNPANKAEEEKARDDKPVTTTVYDTLEYALGIYASYENLQYQKNATNRKAVGTVMWKDEPFLVDLPVDELLGLESRLQKIRALIADAPTLDASKRWKKDETTGAYVWQLQELEKTTKTEKVVVPVVLSPATDKHPAQIEKTTRDINVGVFATMRRSGACTTAQKADALVLIDTLLVEVKKARMRANQTEVETGKIAEKLVNLILSPFKQV